MLDSKWSKDNCFYFFLNANPYTFNVFRFIYDYSCIENNSTN